MMRRGSPRLDRRILRHQHLYHATGHGWRHVAGFRGLGPFRLRARARIGRFRYAGENLLDGLQRDLLELVVHSDVIGFSPSVFLPDPETFT